MTSKWLASKIEEGLGLFFEDVDSESITCALWAGRIELTDLKVKASALDKLDLPFPVYLVASSIKRLVLEINWKIITAPPVTSMIRSMLDPFLGMSCRLSPGG